jgi:beta-glucosidase-like glycosyl hydrolase
MYAQPFLKSVMAGVGSIMCSYSTLFCCLYGSFFHDIFSVDLLNGTYVCENDKLMNDILKREFGFQGCEYLSTFKHYLLTFSIVQLS